MMSFNLRATELEVVPKSPLVGETFNLVFKLDVKGSEEPYISFDSGNAEVIGKSQQGLSINTQIINGKFSTKRELSIVYELSTDKAGPLRISNIKVERGNNEEKLKDVSLIVLAEREKAKDIFGLILSSKQKIYVGEAINVGYYIYYKNQLGTFDILNFPKLNGFIKRFRNPNESAQAADYAGNVYRRSEKYAAILFPEKEGKLILDPVKFKVQYTERADQGQYGGYGFGMERVANKEISTNRIELEVLPLPSENVPPSFSGLVGEHEFKLEISKTKFLVNEPVEAKLVIQGPGALEKYEAPSIFKHNNLEEFDKKVEVVDLPNGEQRKTIEYTFLARGDLKLDERNMEVSYFNPSSGQYVRKSIQVPGITVEGGSLLASSSNNQNTASSENTESSPLKMNEKKESSTENVYILAPIFSQNIYSLGDKISKALISLLIVFCIFMMTSLNKRQIEGNSISNVYKDIKRNGLTYSTITKIGHYIDHKLELRDAFKVINLDSDTNRKYLEIIGKIERMNYSEDGQMEKLKVETKLLKKLEKAIKKYKSNEY
jgi:hypothetical protein